MKNKTVKLEQIKMPTKTKKKRTKTLFFFKNTKFPSFGLTSQTNVCYIKRVEKESRFQCLSLLKILLEGLLKSAEDSKKFSIVIYDITTLVT